MLTALLDREREQRKIRDAGLTDVRRVARRGTRQAARMLAAYQAHAIDLALSTAPDILSEQGIDTASDADVRMPPLLTGVGAADLMDQADTNDAFDRLIASLIIDAGRTAGAVDMATRPAVTGHVRYVTTPCCARCAVLAGRVYRWDATFLRHPRCDCIPTPTNLSTGRELASNPDAMFRAGQIRGLSRGDTQALNNGADLGQVVNVRRKAAGMTEGSSVVVRSGRLTPQGIMRVSSDRAEALTLLQRHGYIT